MPVENAARFSRLRGFERVSPLPEGEGVVPAHRLNDGTPQLGRVDNGAALSTREVPGCQWKTLSGFPRYEVSSESALTPALSPRERGR